MQDQSEICGLKTFGGWKREAEMKTLTLHCPNISSHYLTTKIIQKFLPENSTFLLFVRVECESGFYNPEHNNNWNFLVLSVNLKALSLHGRFSTLEWLSCQFFATVAHREAFLKWQRLLSIVLMELREWTNTLWRVNVLPPPEDEEISNSSNEKRVWSLRLNFRLHEHLLSAVAGILCVTCFNRSLCPQQD